MKPNATLIGFDITDWLSSLGREEHGIPMTLRLEFALDDGRHVRIEDEPAERHVNVTTLGDRFCVSIERADV